MPRCGATFDEMSPLRRRGEGGGLSRRADPPLKAKALSPLPTGGFSREISVGPYLRIHGARLLTQQKTQHSPSANSMHRLPFLLIIVMSALNRRKHRYELTKCAAVSDNEKQTRTSTGRMVPDKEFVAECITSIGLSDLHLARWVVVGYPLANLLCKFEVVVLRWHIGHFCRDGDSSRKSGRACLIQCHRSFWYLFHGLGPSAIRTSRRNVRETYVIYQPLSVTMIKELWSQQNVFQVIYSSLTSVT